MTTVDMFVDGAVAAAAATVLSNPFDVMRTRMQLQGELCRTGQYQVIYRNLMQGMLRVGREEGMTALQKGLTSAVLWQVTMNGIRLGLYPTLKEDLCSLTGSESFVLSIAAGALCGFVGAFVSSPLNMVKTRLQSHRNTMVSAHGHVLSTSSTGAQHAYTGMADALRRIWREGGVRGLWHGASIASQRTMIGSATQLTAYDVTKATLCRRCGGLDASDARVHAAAATVASMCVVLFMNPLDVVMTRMYNQSSLHAHSAYTGNVARATWTIYTVEGVTGLYKGSMALFARTAPHTIAMFLVLEWLRSMRERYTSRAYTSGSHVRKSVRFAAPAHGKDDGDNKSVTTHRVHASAATTTAAAAAAATTVLTAAELVDASGSASV